ncbi:uncharacterized protein LOC127880227 isoform X2 [Dreissena polymorpha]|uniref:uncharacterized protein LOC127880227 isoform X2 n=1 Tax=Dreissena polymorpha TaxID=45954 RepID=UPI002264D413|nr:uncharacterized protein LOC127880227 isoform X2 [Dreissena polymorpha]
MISKLHTTNLHAELPSHALNTISAITKQSYQIWYIIIAPATFNTWTKRLMMKKWFLRILIACLLSCLMSFGMFFYYQKDDLSSIRATFFKFDNNNLMCSVLKERNTKIKYCNGSIPVLQRDVRHFKRWSVYKARLTHSEYEAQMGVIRQIQTVCETNSIPFFFYGGSLIGSYRHFGPVPWDDDIDILLNVSDKQKLRDSVRGSTEYTLLEFKENLWKFFKTNRSKSLETNKNYMWPFIDVLFYGDDGKNLTLLWDNVVPYPTFYKTDVLPLWYMPFDTLVVPVPRKPEIVVKIVHGDISLCVSGFWNHQNEEPLLKELRLPCTALYLIYPFVHRTMHNDLIKEELRIGNQIHMTIVRTA